MNSASGLGLGRMYNELIGLKGIKLYNLVVRNEGVWTRAVKGKAGTGLGNGNLLYEYK
jgi:hypothetical protein